MPITETRFKLVNGSFTSEVESATDTYLGRTLKVRQVVKDVNHSDTLDYTDFRATECTEALVYVGREKPRYDFETPGDNPLVPVEPKDRFKWVDCTNIFVWRGSPQRVPRIDALALLDGNLIEDYEVWQAIQLAAEQAAEARRIAHEKRAREEKEEAERNRPVVGKKMVVFKGRKVPIGTTGVVAYIHPGGSVLLKPEANWRDRSVQGTWVSAANLKAVV